MHLVARRGDPDLREDVDCPAGARARLAPRRGDERAKRRHDLWIASREVVLQAVAAARVRLVAVAEPPSTLRAFPELRLDADSLTMGFDDRPGRVRGVSRGLPACDLHAGTGHRPPHPQ